MKRHIILFTLIGTIVFHTNVLAYNDDILFRDIPWETSYTDTVSLMSEFDFHAMYGENYKKFPVDDILYGVYKGEQPENSGINIIASIIPHIEVAGYEVSKIDMYFAFKVVDGVLTQSETDSELYGATYEFSSENVDAMSNDLRIKLDSIYGEPDDISEDDDWYGNKYTYTHWSGANDTELVLKSEDRKDNSKIKDAIYISYAWRGGDSLLLQASDAIGVLNSEAEAEKYGNADISGL